MEAGHLALRPSLFALRPLIESALEMFGAQAAERRIALRVSIAGDVPEELYEDPGRLRQVLINLLSNAVKFAEPARCGSSPSCAMITTKNASGWRCVIAGR